MAGIRRYKKGFRDCVWVIIVYDARLERERDYLAYDGVWG